jgi:hypothetical protein
MRDITRKLELLIARFPEYEKVGAYDEYREACAEALAEINRLRTTVRLRNAVTSTYLTSEFHEVDAPPDGWKQETRTVGVWPNTLSVIDNLPEGWRCDLIGDNWREVARAATIECDAAKIGSDTTVSAGAGLRILSRPNGAKVAEPVGDGVALKSMAHPEPAPDPWGSPFAMNTENWR